MLQRLFVLVRVKVLLVWLGGGSWNCFAFWFFVVALAFTLYITLLESDNAPTKNPQTCILVVNYISGFLEHLCRLFFFLDRLHLSEKILQE